MPAQVSFAAVQGLAPRIDFPAGFTRPYRCVVRYIKGYTMEELNNFIWIGCMIAKKGPDGFQTLWALLQPLLKHHLYGFDATPSQCAAAAAGWDAYSAKLEEFVDDGKVRFHNCV